MPPLLAIEIGGTKLQIVTGDGTGIIQERHRFSVSKAQGAGGIRRQIETTLQGICGKIKPAAMGVGFGGPVNRPTGRIACSHQIEGWSDFPLAEWLHSLTSAPVFVDNDANVAALGEAVHGAGQGFNPVFYVTLGSGVGGALAASTRSICTMPITSNIAPFHLPDVPYWSASCISTRTSDCLAG